MQRLDNDVSRLIEVFESQTLKDIIATHKSLVKKRQDRLSIWETSYPSVNDYDSKELHYYITYVYLIAGSFGQLDSATLMDISEIATMIIEPFRHFLNEHYEQEEGHVSEKAFILNHQQLMGLRRLESMLDANSMKTFWNYFEKYSNQMIEGFNLASSRHQDQIKPYDDGEFEKIAIGLNAYSKIIIPIIAGLTGRFDRIEPIETALDHYFTAHKIFLDLKCWKRDLALGRYTRILTEVLLENQDAFDGFDVADEKCIMKILYGAAYDERHLLTANRTIEQALFETAGNEPCQRALRSFQNRVNLLLYDFRTLKGLSKRTYTAKDSGQEPMQNLQGHLMDCDGEHKEESFLNGSDLNDSVLNESDLKDRKELKTAVAKSIDRACDWLIDQSRGQYPELTHWGTFLHHYGFTAKEQVVPGNVYYRTYMLNTLDRLYHKGILQAPKDFDTLLSREKAYVFSSRHAYSDYGWGQFPESPELPPDIGTLAEIIHCALKAGDKEVLTMAEEVITFILKNNQRSDGAILSWITDKKKDEFLRNSKSVHCIYIRMLLKRIYKKPIVVTVAAFLNALHQLDADKYREPVQAGYEWILSQQQEEGYWKYHYYTGKMMGISKIMRLSKTMGVTNKNLEKTLGYLQETQNINGAWGDDCGDPKETAFALLALKDACDMGLIHIDQARPMVERGMQYLLCIQTQTGYWHGCDFAEIQIKNLSTEPADLIEYRSATLTTGIALEAIAGFMELIA